MLFNYGPVGFVRDQVSNLLGGTVAPIEIPTEEIFSNPENQTYTGLNQTLSSNLEKLLEGYSEYLPNNTSSWVEQAQENPWLAAAMAVPATVLGISLARRIWRKRGDEILKEINIDKLLETLNNQVNDLDKFLDTFADKLGQDVVDILKKIDTNTIISLMLSNAIFSKDNKVDLVKLLTDKSAPESLANMIQVMVHYLAENQDSNAYQARGRIQQARKQGDLKEAVEGLVVGYAQAISSETPERREAIAKKYGVSLESKKNAPKPKA